MSTNNMVTVVMLRHIGDNLFTIGELISIIIQDVHVYT